MAPEEEDLPQTDGHREAERLPRSRHGWGRRRKIAVAILALLLLALLTVWSTRERIADDLIAGQLKAMGVPATYDIVSIGPDKQVLRNIVVGDPARPDLTIAEAQVGIGLDWGRPAIRSVTLRQPRLYGSYRDGKLSFGTLDPMIFTDGEEPFRLPDLDLAVIDGGGLLESDMGPVGVMLEGRGRLRGGFAGELAAVAPELVAGDCRAAGASAYGTVRIGGEKPRFAGPLRLRSLDCGAGGAKLADAGIRLDLTADPSLDGAEGTAGLAMGELSLGENRVGAAGGNLRVTYRKEALTARYELTARDVSTPQAAAGSANLSGVLRGGPGFARIELDGDLSGSGIRLGDGLDAVLADAAKATDGTLAAPLLAQMRTALRRKGAESRLAASFLMRRAKGDFSLVVPQASLRGGSGQNLFALSRFRLTDSASDEPAFAGNFATAGDGLPRIAGRLEREPGGEMAIRMRMAEYRAGDSRLTVPALTVLRRPDGALGFAGEARMSGALPGGRTENLILPVQGNWSGGSGFSLWRECVTLSFDRLALANLLFERRSLQLCPPRGAAIVRSGEGGLRIAAGAPSLDVSGRLGASPIRIRSGAIGVAVPGTLAARELDVALGPPDTASRFRVANLEARIGGEVAGRFSGSDVFLAAVPLDILDASGDWRFAGGRLTLANGSFRLEDREAAARFQPLIARGATLSLIDNRISADALLREPRSDREVMRSAIRHDLSSGAGSADLFVDGLVFDADLQPDTVSRLALGVVANASGTVRGQGRIDWDERKVTSSGSFTTDSMDFAAAFGPVKGAAGTIRFTDLLGMVTAPDQKLRIASINPGIEATDGEIVYELRPDSVLAIEGGSWPFLDGRLTLRPVIMNIGVAEVRRYVLVMEGVDAARFVERMELANISATGIFDGALPLVFDEQGGRIEGGLLTSRPPGGNVSYVGALSYEDLSPMANYAFEALKSMNYREMSIGMDGALEGEIVTRVRFRGVSQGEGTTRNFITNRIASLPIQFNVNLRAPFFQLLTSFKSFYDPAYVRDPRTLGLLDSEGRPVSRPILLPEALLPPIQPRESEDLR